MDNSIKDKFKEDIETLIKERMEEWKVPGLSIAVVKDGEVILSEGYGFRNIKDNLKVTENTIFPLASVTKAFTATAASILVEEGKLNWDTPVREYIPWFKMYDPVATERVTIRDMLCHRTGLPRHDIMRINTPYNKKEVVEKLRYLQHNKDFRTTFQYQNYTYITVGYLIELVTGQSWEEFIQGKILQPLNMDNTFLSIEKVQQLSDYTKPYVTYNKDAMEIPFLFKYDANMPCGGINSNIKDMTKWLLYNINNSKSKLKELHTPQILCGEASKFSKAKFQSYGMGWFVENFREHTLIQHGGNIPGISTRVCFIPDENVGLVILSNMNNSLLPMLLQYEVFDLLLGNKEKDWNKEFKELLKLTASINNGEQKKSRKEGTSPSHVFEEYAGKYENPGYGILEVYTEGDKLKLKYNTFKFDLQHIHYDIFQMGIPQLGLSFPVSFQMNRNGEISKVSIPLEPTPNVNEIEFIKLPE